MPILAALVVALAALQAPATLRVEVRSAGAPVDDADVVVAGATYHTTSDGVVSVAVAAGSVTVTVTKPRFAPVTTSIDLHPGQTQTVIVDLEPEPTVEEQVTVSATRTNQRLEDVPMRVEVLDADEIGEKVMMTPGDVVMMLNEMGGLRVQATSPSLGAASVRIQGMRGRYTRVLEDGLPLFGQQVGGLGLLQIPPTDLAQVEVIKGVASALYGAGAMGGVINLVSRRPGRESAQEFLVNRSSRGATDGVAFLASPLSDTWGATLLAGGHWQQENDVDGDGWADLAGYDRGEVRPRVFWDDHQGRSLFATAGATWESRAGGTIEGASLSATGQPYRETLDTQRYDVGLVAQTLVGGAYVVTARAAAAWQAHDHRFGDVLERDRHDTGFGEVSLRGTAPRQTFVVGAALERDAFDPRDVPRFAYTFTVPGIFAQDDVQVTSWLALSASGRIDWQNQYGTFVSPRLSALVRAGAWTTRASAGTGFAAPTPLTEETEAAGLSRLTIRGPLAAERGRSASLDVTRTDGPLSYTATLFASRIRNAVIVDHADTYVLYNALEPTTNAGAELLATLRREPFVATASYTYVRARELDAGSRVDVPLTPRHSVGVYGMWEREETGRIGLEWYYTGRQRLEANPFRGESAPYMLFGALVERRFGAVRLFVNAENLGNVKQTDFDPLVRPAPAADGRWTVDAWAPLDGRNVNAGVRLVF